MFKTGAALKTPFEPQTKGSIIRSIAEPVAVVGINGLVREVNRDFALLLGYPENGLIGKPFATLFRNKKVFSGDLQTRLVTEGRIKNTEVELVSKDGADVRVEFSGAITRDYLGNPAEFVVLVRDLAEQKKLISEFQATKEELSRRVEYLEEFRSGVIEMLRDLDRGEQELERAYCKLKETQAQLIQSSKLSALGELAAGLAHELNQPLTVIKGLAHNLVRNTRPHTPEHEKTKLIHEASKKMELIIRHLGTFSRIEEQRFEPVDLNRVINDAFLMVRELLLKGSIDIRTKLADVPPVLGSANRLEQVVINLVTNAKDAMPGGGTIEISTGHFTTRGSPFVELVIRDTGAGMDAAVMEKIFDPFFTTKETGRGTGLGLSISYGIIKEHGGEITVKSAPDMGSTFRIILPAYGQKTMVQ